MNLVVAEKDLYRACEVIFGQELDISRDFLEYLQLSGVKCAYRKRAFETHPDRFVTSDQAPPNHKNGLLFHDVQQAYESLRQYLEAREKGVILLGNHRRADRKPYRPSGYGPGQNPDRRYGNGRQRHANGFQNPGGFRRPSASTSSFQGFWNLDELYRGPLPQRRLLLGHFLYYSGVASWRTIAQALVWQRSERPRLGEISRRYGMLSDREIAMILQNRQTRQRFGEAALKLGLLSEPQLRLLVQAQRRLQRKFGEYFVAEKILTPEKLTRLLMAYHRHNDRLVRQFTGRPGL